MIFTNDNNYASALAYTHLNNTLPFCVSKSMLTTCNQAA